MPEILDALTALDRDPDVDVIVLARGGGSVEDLLPFSDEALCRGVAACRTPVVSAIGHEPDTPLVDHVADVRAATPTDAAKRIVPDLAEETAHLAQLRRRMHRALHAWVEREDAALAALRRRPVLADPLGPIAAREDAVVALRGRARQVVDAGITARVGRPAAPHGVPHRPGPRRDPGPGLRDRPARAGRRRPRPAVGGRALGGRHPARAPRRRRPARRRAPRPG